jgi:hypothetical protein
MLLSICRILIRSDLRHVLGEPIGLSEGLSHGIFQLSSPVGQSRQSRYLPRPKLLIPSLFNVLCVQLILHIRPAPREIIMSTSAGVRTNYTSDRFYRYVTQPLDRNQDHPRGVRALI